MDWLLEESAEDDFDSDTESTDNKPDGKAPPTTRWNRQNFDYRRGERVSRVHPKRVVGFAATSKSEKREYRQWHSRVVRLMGSRTICWLGSTPYKFRLKAEDLRKRCFVCKLELETDPGHLKSFPVRAWMLPQLPADRPWSPARSRRIRIRRRAFAAGHNLL